MSETVPEQGGREKIPGGGGGRMVWMSAPLTSGGEPYWHAGVRILRRDDGRVLQAAWLCAHVVGRCMA